MRLNIRFAGAGGQGVILSSILLAKAYGLGEGYNISQTQSYGPEARGGACKAELVVSDREIDYMKVDQADVFIAYNQTGYNQYAGSVGPDARVLINSSLVQSDLPDCYRIPATEIAEEMNLPVAVNIVMLGALTRLLPHLHFETMKTEITKNFDGRFAEGNLQAFGRGYHSMNSYLQQQGLQGMEKVMVCVTRQKTCDRLIRYGRNILGENEGELSIVHVTDRQFRCLDHSADGEALDYLYEKAMEYGTNLTVIRSGDVVETLAGLVLKNGVECIVMGETGAAPNAPGLVGQLRDRIRDQAQVVVIPA